MKKLKDFGSIRELKDTFFMRTNMPGIYRCNLYLVSEEFLVAVTNGATNKGFIKNMRDIYVNEDMGLNEGFSVLMHEVLHKVLNCDVRAEAVGAYENKNLALVFNIAQDLVINDMVIKFKADSKDNEGKFFKNNDNQDFIDNQNGLLREVSNLINEPTEKIVKMSTERIYNKIVDVLPESAKKGKDGNSNCKQQECQKGKDGNSEGKDGNSNCEQGNSNGEQGNSEGKDGNSNGEQGNSEYKNKNESNNSKDGKDKDKELSEKEKQEIKEKFEGISDKVKEMNKKYGNGLVDITDKKEAEKFKKENPKSDNPTPVEFTADAVEYKDNAIRTIGHIGKNWEREFNIANGIKIPWDKIISKDVRGYFRGYQDISFKRYNVVGNRSMRRMGRRNVMVPSFVKNKPSKLGVVVDTSASISQKNLNTFLSIINSYLDHFKGSKARVISIDTDVNTDQEVNSIKTIKVSGGGGTDLRPAIKMLDEDPKVKNILIFTDGYTPFNDSINTKSVIVIDGASEGEIEDYLPKWGKKLFISY